MPESVLRQIQTLLRQFTPALQGAAKTTWVELVQAKRVESILALITCACGLLVWGAIMAALLYVGYQIIRRILSMREVDEEDNEGLNMFLRYVGSGLVGLATVVLCAAWPGPNLSANLQGLGSETFWTGAFAPDLAVTYDVYEKALSR